MKILIQGTHNFSDYDVVFRAMGVALSDVTETDREVIVYSLGPIKLNSNVSEFINKTQASLKQRGIDLRFYHIGRQAIKDLKMFDKFFFFCTKGEKLSLLGKEFEAIDANVLIFRF